MLRGLGRIASLALALALATGLVGCSQYGKLQAKRAIKEANVLYVQQEYKRAAVLYEEAITNDPELSAAYFYLANSYDNLFKPSRKGEPENDAYLTKAIEFYTKASEKETDPTMRKRSFELCRNRRFGRQNVVHFLHFEVGEESHSRSPRLPSGQRPRRRRSEIWDPSR